MRLHLNGARWLIVPQRLQIPFVLLEETLELLAVKYLRFDLTDARIVHCNACGGTPAILSTIAEGLHFLHLELIKPKGKRARFILYNVSLSIPTLNSLDNVVVVLLLGTILDIGKGASQLGNCFAVGSRRVCSSCCCLCNRHTGVHLGQRLFAKTTAQLLLDSLVEGHLLDADKGQHGTFVSATRCASSSMYVGGNIAWEIKVNDVVDTLEINATRCTGLEISMLGSLLLFARWLLQQMLIRGNDDVVAALVELTDGVDAYVRRQLRVEHT